MSRAMVNLKLSTGDLKTSQINVRKSTSDASCVDLLSLSVDISGFIFIYYAH